MCESHKCVQASSFILNLTEVATFVWIQYSIELIQMILQIHRPHKTILMHIFSDFGLNNHLFLHCEVSWLLLNWCFGGFEEQWLAQSFCTKYCLSF